MSITVRDLSPEGMDQYYAQLHFRYQTAYFELKWERSNEGETYTHPPDRWLGKHYPRGLYHICPCYEKGEYKLYRAMIAEGEIGYVHLESWIKGQKKAKELAQMDLNKRADRWVSRFEPSQDDDGFEVWEQRVLSELYQKYPDKTPEDLAAEKHERALQEAKKLQAEFESWKKPGKLDFGF